MHADGNSFIGARHAPRLPGFVAVPRRRRRVSPRGHGWASERSLPSLRGHGLTVSSRPAPGQRAARERSSHSWAGVVPVRFVALIGSGEDADAAGADEESDDDEDDAEQNLSADRRDDAGDDEDDGENPQQSGHETFLRFSDRRGGDTAHVTTCSGGCVHPEG